MLMNLCLFVCLFVFLVYKFFFLSCDCDIKNMCSLTPEE